jgi:hypothetical protein
MHSLWTRPRVRDKTARKEGVLVHLDYKGTREGISYPGVPTLLGMDVGLEYGWDVTGDPGYTGHAIDGVEHPCIEKQASFEMPTVPIVPNFVNGHTSSRQSSISSTSSARPVTASERS